MPLLKLHGDNLAGDQKLELMHMQLQACMHAVCKPSPMHGELHCYYLPLHATGHKRDRSIDCTCMQAEQPHWQQLACIFFYR